MACRNGSCGANQASDFENEDNLKPSLNQKPSLFTNLLNDPTFVKEIDGRDRLIYQMMQILARKNKPNVLLLGEPGVGKSTIVQGLAYFLKNDLAIKQLQDYQLWSLDLNYLKAGTGTVGAIEDKLMSFKKQIANSKQPVILFIDEIHQIVNDQVHNQAIVNFLKPLLTTNFVRIIGATTNDEYQQIFAKDRALERRFSNLQVDPLDPFTTVKILINLWKQWNPLEPYEQILLEQLVDLTQQYLPNRVLPDKAVDVFDQALVLATSEFNHQSLPEWQSQKDDLDEDRAEENQDLVDEQTGAASLDTYQTKLNKLKAKKSKLEAEYNQMVVNYTVYKREEFKQFGDKIKAVDDEIAILENQNEIINLEQLKITTDQQQETGDQVSKSQKGQQSKTKLQPIPLDLNHVKKVVAILSGVPIDQLTQELNQDLSDKLNQRIIGQNHVIKEINQTLQSWFANLKDPNRPIGSFLFCGPSGVGKTLIGKALANFLFLNEKQKYYQVDCSDFNNPGDLSKLLGSTAGFVGYGEQGGLVAFVQNNPYSIIIFDEIEKAKDMGLFNVLLRVLDQGELIDAQNRQINFKNTFIIMTTNVGADLNCNDVNYQSEIKNELLNHGFKIEFLNRINQIIGFKNLNPNEIIEVAKLSGQNWAKYVDLTHQLKFTIDETIYPHLLERSNNKDEAGARGVEYVINHSLNTFLAQPILAQILEPSEKYEISLLPSSNTEGSKLIISNQEDDQTVYIEDQDLNVAKAAKDVATTEQATTQN